MSKAKTVPQPKSKYDWAALKSEYILGDDIDVTAFFKRRYGVFNSSMSHNSSGWAHERKEYRQKVADEIGKQAFDNEVRTKATALKKVLNSFIVDFNDKKDKEGNVIYRFQDLPIKTRIMVWQMWRIENNLPTTLSKFQELPGPPQNDALDEYTRKVLKENGIDPSQTMK